MEKITFAIPRIAKTMEKISESIGCLSCLPNEIQDSFVSYDIETGEKTYLEMPEEVSQVKEKIRTIIAQNKKILDELSATLATIDGIQAAL